MSDPLPRRVEYSAAILQRIKALAADAAKQGRLPSFRRALTTIDDALRTRPLPPSDNPDTFGDPAYTLKHLKLLVCHALVPPVTLHFAVSLEPQKIEPRSSLASTSCASSCWQAAKHSLGTRCAITISA